MPDRCCYIDPATRAPCEALAEWQIRERGTTFENIPDGSGTTQACTAHVGDLLGHAGEPLPGRSQWFEVVPLPVDRDVAANP